MNELIHKCLSIREKLRVANEQLVLLTDEKKRAEKELLVLARIACAKLCPSFSIDNWSVDTGIIFFRCSRESGYETYIEDFGVPFEFFTREKINDYCDKILEEREEIRKITAQEYKRQKEIRRQQEEEKKREDELKLLAELKDKYERD